MEPRLQRFWDWRAAGNFIGGGTGAGVLATTAVAALLGADPRSGILLGLACVGAGLGFVWLEIGRAWRAFNVFFHPQTSWMTREAMVSVPLLGGGLASAWLGWPWLSVALAPLALVYPHCQGHIIQAARGIPAWRTPRMLALNFAGGLAEGCGLYLVAAATPLIAAPETARETAAGLLAVLCAARFASWMRYRSGLAGDAPSASLAVLAGHQPALLIAGTVLPVALAAAALALPAAWAAALAGALAAASGWHLKLVLITRAAHEQGFALPRSPARGGGAPGPGARPGWG